MGNMDTEMKNKYEIEMVKIRKIIQETPGMRTYVLSKRMDFRPGQFLLASVLGIGESAISFSSYPDVRITVDEVGNVTRAMGKLKPGDSIGVRGPYGNSYPVDELRGRDVYIISGGCGLAPMRSLIKYYEQNQNQDSRHKNDSDPEKIPSSAVAHVLSKPYERVPA